MSYFSGVSQSGFPVRRETRLPTSLEPLLLLVIGVAGVGAVCLLSLILGLLTGIFGAGWLS